MGASLATEDTEQTEDREDRESVRPDELNRGLSSGPWLVDRK